MKDRDGKLIVDLPEKEVSRLLSLSLSLGIEDI